MLKLKRKSGQWKIRSWIPFGHSTRYLCQKENVKNPITERIYHAVWQHLLQWYISEKQHFPRKKMIITWAMGFFSIPRCRLFNPSTRKSLNLLYGGWWSDHFRSSSNMTTYISKSWSTWFNCRPSWNYNNNPWNFNSAKKAYEC